MKMYRRELLALLPALVLASRASGQAAGTDSALPDQSGFQAELAPFWDQLAMLPSIRSPATGDGADGICYMFTNKDCAVCQVVHQEFGHGFKRLEMRYIIYPWPGEAYRELNYMYRPETTMADYETYMAHKLKATSPSDSGAQVDLIMAVAADMTAKLIEGNAFGTPFFFNAMPGDRPGSLVYRAGDIVAMGPLLDRAA